MNYGVFQTANEESTGYDGKGFNSPRSSTGSFVYVFTKPGTYFFSSGYIDAYGAIDMKGKVVVEAPVSKIEDVNVEVDGELQRLSESKFRKSLLPGIIWKFSPRHYSNERKFLILMPFLPSNNL